MMNVLTSQFSVYVFALLLCFGSKAYAEREINQVPQNEPYSLATLLWPPYVNVSQKTYIGYDVEVVREAFNAVDKQVDFTALPWSRALLSASKGLYIGIFPEYYQTSREKDFVYSAGYQGGRLYLFKHKSDTTELPHSPRVLGVGAFKGLKDKKIGIVRGYVNTSEFDEASFLNKVEASSDVLLLNMLYNRRVDLIVMDFNTAQHLMSENKPKYDNIVPMKTPLGQKVHHIGFSKLHANHKQALLDFNKGLSIIKKNGVLNYLYLKYHIGG